MIDDSFFGSAMGSSISKGASFGAPPPVSSVVVPGALRVGDGLGGVR